MTIEEAKALVQHHFDEFVNKRNHDIVDQTLSDDFYDHDGPGGKPTDRERQINECLVSWDQLDEKDKKKDWNQIEAIPKILQSVGRGIYR